MTLKRLLLFGLLIVFAAWFLLSLLVDVIPPRNLTVTRMWVTKRRIIQFAQRENRLPSDLSELPPMPGYDTETRDAWGRPFIYKSLPDGRVILESYGKDGLIGGTGDNADLIGIFESKNPQGDWVKDELKDWTKATIPFEKDAIGTNEAPNAVGVPVQR